MNEFLWNSVKSIEKRATYTITEPTTAMKVLRGSSALFLRKISYVFSFIGHQCLHTTPTNAFCLFFILGGYKSRVNMIRERKVVGRSLKIFWRITISPRSHKSQAKGGGDLQSTAVCFWWAPFWYRLHILIPTGIFKPSENICHLFLAYSDPSYKVTSS